MKTRIKQVDDAMVVSIEGHLSYETHEPLRDHLFEIMEQARVQHPDKKIIFNFENLEFVGSSGISAFINSLKELTDEGSSPKYCNVATEFQRVMKAFDESNLFQFYESEEKARKSFDN